MEWLYAENIEGYANVSSKLSASILPRLWLLGGNFLILRVQNTAMDLIDQDKHHTIVSSHPSGLSANKPFKNYPAFMHFDHFGEINKYLGEHGKTPILWE